MPIQNGSCMTKISSKKKRNYSSEIMWTKLNDIMQKHNFPKLNFKGFMANNA
jgi:hypothetical protein